MLQKSIESDDELNRLHEKHEELKEGGEFDYFGLEKPEDD